MRTSWTTRSSSPVAACTTSSPFGSHAITETMRASITSATISTASFSTSSVAGLKPGECRTTTRGDVRRGSTTVKHEP